jgi:hypothetical protein
MDDADLIKTVQDHAQRLARIESTLDYLATREQVASIQSELQNVKLILLGSLGAILAQIIVSWIR